MRTNSLPVIGVCPRCAGELVVVARTGERMGSLFASDVLEWRCVTCLYQDKETRHLIDGIEGDWPASKFSGAWPCGTDL
jgi:hypothetical protein